MPSAFLSKSPPGNLPEDLPFDGLTAHKTQGPRTLSRRERAAIIHRIQALMEFWGITPQDLLIDEQDPVIAAPSSRPVKYRHPVSGETWDGQGPHPDWLRQALLREGLRLDELKPAAG